MNSEVQFPPGARATELPLAADAAVTSNAGAVAYVLGVAPCSSVVWPLITNGVVQLHPPV